MPQHSALTGSDLHEPKGAAGASVDTVYVADGAGSGTWVKIDVNNIDASSIFNTNTYFTNHVIDDVSTATKIYIPVSRGVTITKVVSVLYGAITLADSTITVKNDAGASMGTLVIAFTGSGSGTIDTLLPASNNIVAADSFFSIETDGGSTTTMPISFTVEYGLTS
jgi:hypothetical protein